jgi:hypothetical protein
MQKMMLVTGMLAIHLVHQDTACYSIGPPTPGTSGNCIEYPFSERQLLKELPGIAGNHPFERTERRRWQRARSCCFVRPHRLAIELDFRFTKP